MLTRIETRERGTEFERATPGILTMAFDHAGAARRLHDRALLPAALPAGTPGLDLLHVYGLPTDESELATVAAARRGRRQIVWTPASHAGRAADRLAAVARHLNEHGRDPEARRLVLRALAEGALVLATPAPVSPAGPIAEMLDLCDLLIFACDEELRRFVEDHDPSRQRVAVCPLALRPGPRGRKGGGQGPVLVAGSAGDWLVREALRGLKREVLTVAEAGPLGRREAAMLAIAAPALVDVELLGLAASGLPTLCDPRSFAFDYLGPAAELVPFEDVDRLRARIAANLLEPGPVRNGEPWWELFDESRAAAALGHAYRDLLRPDERFGAVD